VIKTFEAQVGHFLLGCKCPVGRSIIVQEHTSPPCQKNKLEASFNVMAHAQEPEFVFRRNGRTHLNRRGRQFIRLLAADVCASAVVMMDTVYTLHSPVSPSLPLPCVTVCCHIPTRVYCRKIPSVYIPITMYTCEQLVTAKNTNLIWKRDESALYPYSLEGARVQTKI